MVDARRSCGGLVVIVVGSRQDAILRVRGAQVKAFVPVFLGPVHDEHFVIVTILFVLKSVLCRPPATILTVCFYAVVLVLIFGEKREKSFDTGIRVPSHVLDELLFVQWELFCWVAICADVIASRFQESNSIFMVFGHFVRCCEDISLYVLVPRINHFSIKLFVVRTAAENIRDHRDALAGNITRGRVA